MKQMSSFVRTILFVGAFGLAGVAVIEKLVNLFDLTLMIIGDYSPARLLELSAIALLFVIALELNEIRSRTRGGSEAAEAGHA